MMKRAIMSAMGVALTVALAAPAYATAFTAADMNIEFGPNGTITATFGNSGIVGGAFTDTFSFTIDDNGFGSGSVVTTAEALGGTNDTDLISVDVNGIPALGITGALNEAVFVNAVPITAGVLNVVTISGFSRGNGSYGANATFSPFHLPVPEPATWTMLVAGFAMIGMAARKRNRTARVSFS